MLQLKKITKVYKTEDYTQKALDEVSICFRRNEFASILGPSGSGKTTLLNIIGGLDQYDSGELIINEVSTKSYKDRNWDSYRNHRVGFVFQSYNLIPHQSVLANVELALTLSGIPKKERIKRAKQALTKVGLAKHINKRPSQLSGGQMQRVAIARALVNDPDILLADEPTGALDSETSIQIMEIIKEIAKEKLVIMVTHNPELAEQYSTRIVKLKDGKITDDSNPYGGEEDTRNEYEEELKKSKKTSMSLKTALSLSLNNLMTKKGRTILTAFAGSIGIIGIALILSLSSGVNNYITNVQKEAMLSYPIRIDSETMDLAGFLETGKEVSTKIDVDHKKDAVYSDISTIKMAQEYKTSITKNNLTKFKEYLDKKDNKIRKLTGENGITYSYDAKFKIFNYDPDGKLVNSDGSTFESRFNDGSFMGSMVISSTVSPFQELMPGKKDELISKAIIDDYKVLEGHWPKEYNEVVLIVDKNNEILASVLYNLGILPSTEYKDILDKLKRDEDVKIESKKIHYDDLVGKTFKLITESDLYVKDNNDNYEYVIDNEGKLEELLKDKSLELKISGVVRQNKDSKNDFIATNVGYTKALTDWVIEHTNNSEVVKAQEENKEVSVLNGLKFSVSNDEEKANEAKKYLQSLGVSDKAKLTTSIISKTNPDMATQMMSMSEEQLSYFLDRYLQNPDNEVLVSIYNNYISTGTYEENMTTFGRIDLNTPSSIRIYPDTFEDKDKITEEINRYNEKVKEKDKIAYTDYVGLLMSSVTTIINAISYVLIAFVSISLIVSSIMIAIITYISVLERTKEIGILRAVGASKKDVTRVFNAETFIEGFVAGLIGIIITVILNVPINIIIKGLTDISGISKLPISGAIILIIISVILTVIAGVVPSRMAAKKDPVEALRSE